MDLHKLTIGQMAELNHVSEQALRLYDREKLLIPDYIDPYTGYRYYHIAQSAQLDLIQSLKAYGMTLRQIRSYLAVDNIETSIALLENGMVREEDIRPFAGKIRKEAQRMTKLVSDIIDLTKLDSGSGNMQRQNTNLFLIARNAIDSLQQEADSSGITLSLSGGSAVVFGISPVLYSIVYNLCDNAIKYNRPGGSVDAAVRNVEGGTELCVRDTGIGIPAEEQERIFERFYRVDKSHSGEIGGTGLGLSIVKHGVMLHNGKIKVSSEPGLGTEIRVLFPEPVNEHT